MRPHPAKCQTCRGTGIHSHLLCRRVGRTPRPPSGSLSLGGLFHFEQDLSGEVALPPTRSAPSRALADRSEVLPLPHLRSLHQQLRHPWRPAQCPPLTLNSRRICASRPGSPQLCSPRRSFDTPRRRCPRGVSRRAPYSHFGQTTAPHDPSEKASTWTRFFKMTRMGSVTAVAGIEGCTSGIISQRPDAD